VLGDIAPDRLGITYAHEHVILDSPMVEDRLPDILLDDAEAAVAELALCRTAGVATVVDALPCAAGRDPGRLGDMSRRSGVAIIATTGLHTRTWYPGRSFAKEAVPEVLADLFVGDITGGIDHFDYRGPVVSRTEHRAGLIKVGTLDPTLDELDRRIFGAAAEAHRRTGAPILTHCEGGRGGMAQVEYLFEVGVAPDRIVLSHTDKVADPAYHRDLMEAGVYLEYDQALRQDPAEAQGTAWLVTEMVAAGCTDQLMLGTDGARRSMWTSLGGAPGLAWLLTDFTAILAERGVDAAAIDRMLIDNPARFFAFEAVT